LEGEGGKGEKLAGKKGGGNLGEGVQVFSRKRGKSGGFHSSEGRTKERMIGRQRGIGACGIIS